MRRLNSAGWIAFGLGLAASTATAASVRECSEKEVDASNVSIHDDPPVRAVVFTGRSNANFEVNVALKLANDGSVACFRNFDSWDGEGPWPLYFPKAAIARQAVTWRYAAPAKEADRWIVQTVRFERVPLPRMAQPKAPASQVAFQHMRTNCYGPCPAYTVTVHGDGRVEYAGVVADITGPLSYRIPAAGAEALIVRQLKRDLWNARDQYVASQPDASHNLLTITVGGHSKRIHDYLGEQVGMPTSVREAEDDVDAVAGVGRWLHLTPDGLHDLEAMGFDFRSQQAADMLVNIIGNENIDDDTIISILVRGAPLSGRTWSVSGPIPDKMSPLIDAAIAANRPVVVEKLIAMGALTAAGVPDKTRVNSAFQTAVSSNSLIFVKRMAEFHPYLTYVPDGASAPQSVLFMIENGDKAFLAALIDMGADPTGRDSDGNTLLHKLGNDPELTDFLLAHGVDINAKNANGETALLVLIDEDAVLHLLDLGADPTIRTEDTSIWSEADLFGWKRVPAWLETHNYHRPK